jgi:hypothetical protein
MDYQGFMTENTEGGTLGDINLKKQNCEKLFDTTTIYFNFG